MHSIQDNPRFSEEAMLPSRLRFAFPIRVRSLTGVLLAMLSYALLAQAESAYVRVSQVGYEEGKAPFRAYLMSTTAQSGGTFRVINSTGDTAYSGATGRLLGKWSHSKTLTYYVYALDFNVPGGDTYTIAVDGPGKAHSPGFAVDKPPVLYPGLLLNTLFFYETERDGPNFIRNALRTAPGHLKDKNAAIYRTPRLDSNDFIDNVPPAAPLEPANPANTDASGGWWDAGDYMKYVQTTSYTTALMQIGIRDFPNQMGASAQSPGATGVGLVCRKQRDRSSTVIRLHRRSGIRSRLPHAHVG
jgi:endoglucanase